MKALDYDFQCAICLVVAFVTIGSTHNKKSYLPLSEPVLILFLNCDSGYLYPSCYCHLKITTRVWHRGLVVKFELRFCTGLNLARGVSDICDGENF